MTCGIVSFLYFPLQSTSAPALGSDAKTLGVDMHALCLMRFERWFIARLMCALCMYVIRDQFDLPIGSEKQRPLRQEHGCSLGQNGDVNAGS